MLTVLFSMGFQSMHSYEHIVAQFSEKICNHETGINKAEITHHHHVGDHCFVCEFTLSAFLASENPIIAFQKTSFYFQTDFLYSKAVSQFFKGSLFALRAPPIF